jgi:hypothetical protein
MDTPARRRHSAELTAELRNRMADLEAPQLRQSSIPSNDSSHGPSPGRRHRWCWEPGEADGTVTQAKKAAWIKHWFSRLLRHLCAALALIIPVLIMSIDPSLLKSLVTSCVFTIGFAVGITLSTLFGGEESVTATAAYAAVLFVFVGVGLGPSSGGS